MRLFDGLDHTDYQDVLRVIGYYVDANKLRQVRLLETEEGVLVQGVPNQPGQEMALTSQLLTEPELRRMLDEAYSRRRRQVGTAPLSSSEVCNAPLPIPTSAVRVQPGWSALQLVLRNIGEAPAHGIELQAQWKHVVLSGYLTHLPLEGETPVVLAQADPALAEPREHEPEPVLRLRIRYQESDGRQYEVRCAFRRPQEGWRINKYPTFRAQMPPPALVSAPVVDVPPELAPDTISVDRRFAAPLVE